MPTKVLLIIKSPPYGNLRAAEGFRIATAMIAMDILPQLLFIDDGIYCLTKNQRPESAGLEPHQERLKTLADLIGLYALKDSMAERNLMFADLNEDLQVKTITLEEAAELIIENETVITF